MRNVDQISERQTVFFPVLFDTHTTLNSSFPMQWFLTGTAVEGPHFSSPADNYSDTLLYRAIPFSCVIENTGLRCRNIFGDQNSSLSVRHQELQASWCWLSRNLNPIIKILIYPHICWVFWYSSSAANVGHRPTATGWKHNYFDGPSHRKSCDEEESQGLAQGQHAKEENPLLSFGKAGHTANRTTCT